VAVLKTLRRWVSVSGSSRAYHSSMCMYFSSPLHLIDSFIGSDSLGLYIFICERQWPRNCPIDVLCVLESGVATFVGKFKIDSNLGGIPLLPWTTETSSLFLLTLNHL